jgi:integrase/recombinase XerD
LTSAVDLRGSGRRRRQRPRQHACGGPGSAASGQSSWKKPYTDRGVRKILARYTQAAGITASISPHTLRHFLFTWLKTQGIDDALIQPYSGHATRQSLDIYSRLALADAQQRYDDVISDFPV